MEKLEYIVYYKNKSFSTFRCYNSLTKEFFNWDKSLMDFTCSNFYLPKMRNYEQNDESLIQYSQLLLEERDELLRHSKFDWITPYEKDGKIFYRNHKSNIERYFNKYCKKNYINKYEPIDNIEYTWITKCNNSGLQYETIGKYESFGSDYKGFYQYIMSHKDFITPMTKGAEKVIQKIPNLIIFGFYRVIISSNDENFRKVFNYSKDNVYTHHSLKFAVKHKEQFKINIELIQDGTPNAYLYYKKETREPFINVCKKWNEKLLQLKKKCPKNSLVKMLSSRCWGVLSRSNKKIIHEDEIDNYDMGWSENVEYQIKDVIHGRNGKIRFQTLNINNPYFYNFRLIPFLNSFGRNLIGELAMSLGISNVLRTMTDSIVCNYDFKSDDQNFIREEKSTGLIIWNGVGKTPNKLA